MENLTKICSNIPFRLSLAIAKLFLGLNEEIGHVSERGQYLLQFALVGNQNKAVLGVAPGAPAPHASVLLNTVGDCSSSHQGSGSLEIALRNQQSRRSCDLEARATPPQCARFPCSSQLWSGACMQKRTSSSDVFIQSLESVPVQLCICS